MKNHVPRLLTLCILLPLLALTACAGTPSAGQNTSDPPSAGPPADVTPSPAPTDWHSGVKTDYSGLTPYKPLEEKYTRLSPGALPELKPSAGYGRLLPYVGEAMYVKGGYNAFNMYGLTTDGGLIVTDPVYARVYQGSAYDYDNFQNINVSAYDLEKLTDKIDKQNPWSNARHAVCALDGSWITKFDYTNVFFTDKVFLCTRDAQRNDIDVFDYSGKLLYNTTTLGCYKDISAQSDYMFMGNYGEGLFSLPLPSGKTVYIDALTGAETYTDYSQGLAFIGGLSRVTENGRFGYIDKSFQIAIKPQYLDADNFYGGKAVVRLKEGGWAVIDEHGEILFQNEGAISRFDIKTYSAFDSGTQSTRYYNLDFKELTTDDQPVTPLYNGWFYYTTDIGAVVLNGSGEKHLLSGVKNISMVSGGLVSYYDSSKANWSSGIKALDGKDIVPLTQNVSIGIVTDKNTGGSYITVSYYGQNSAHETFTIMTKDGKTLLSGKGTAYYDEQCNLFEINDEQSFGYVDMTGNYIFRISLLQYLPD